MQVGYSVSAKGNLGRDGAKKLYATCINLDSGPEKGRQLGRCVGSAGTVTEVTADPNVDYTVHAKNFPVNITGFWENRYKFHVTVDDFEPKPMPMTAEAKTIYQGRKFGDDHVLRCLPAGLPRIFGSPYPMQVLDSGDHYLMVFMQDNTPRRVWMDGRSPPAEQPLTSMGFSKGHWEDRTLVIETTMLTPGWLDGSGYPMSGGNDTRIVERWTVAADGVTIDRTMTVYDKLYTAPLVRTRGSQRGDAKVGLIESEPCDATPFYYELMRARRARAAAEVAADARLRALSVVLGVLARIAAHALGGILALVEHDLVRGRGEQIDLELVRDPQQVDEHVGRLEPHALAALRVEIAALLLGEPLELLDELGRLDRQRHREVLRRVELVPIALGREFR